MTAKVRYIVSGTRRGYRPKPIRRKDNTKAQWQNSSTGNPLYMGQTHSAMFQASFGTNLRGTFSKYIYRFRPNRSVENAIANVYTRLHHSLTYYVIEFDIKGFFDNVNHAKLIRQMWTLGIRDKHFLGKILRMLKAPIKTPNGDLIYPTKGTPQGGIISPLLANIVLNELDHWVESNFGKKPVLYKYNHNKSAMCNTKYQWTKAVKSR